MKDKCFIEIEYDNYAESVVLCILITIALVLFTLFVHDHYYRKGYDALTSFEYAHDSPEDVIRNEDMKLFKNSFEFKTDKELRYVKPMDTNSMVPTFDYGHTLVEIACPCDLKVGDIVSFHYKNMTIVHRIASISQKGIHTKGDNAKYGEFINESDVIGKVIAVLY